MLFNSCRNGPGAFVGWFRWYGPEFFIHEPNLAQIWHAEPRSGKYYFDMNTGKGNGQVEQIAIRQLLDR